MKILHLSASIPVLLGSLFAHEPKMAVNIAKGYEVREHINEFGRLRLDYFRGYPYFYEGDLVFEKKVSGKLRFQP